MPREDESLAQGWSQDRNPDFKIGSGAAVWLSRKRACLARVSPAPALQETKRQNKNITTDLTSQCKNSDLESEGPTRVGVTVAVNTTTHSASTGPGHLSSLALPRVPCYALRGLCFIFPSATRVWGWC